VLERRSSLAEESGAAGLLPTGGFLAGLTSIHWREAWKYGVRAFRYCQQDAGHAVAALRYAAAALGWTARLLTAPGDADVATMLGLDRDADFARVAAPDREHPDALLVVAPNGTDMDAAAARLRSAIDELTALVRGGSWAGLANPVSPDHVSWPAIEEVSAATRKPRGGEGRGEGGGDLPPARSSSRERAARLIRQRRSAVEMDGVTAIDAAAFYTMLDRTLPRPGVPPGDAIPWTPRIHAGVFVHRVHGIPPGL
jgi:nitroreductase